MTQVHQARMNHSPLTRGWRRSLRTEGWYRRRAGWVGTVTIDGNGYRIVLQRTVRTFDDALDVANEVLSELKN